jgi:3-methyladenine DNA glycosylase/8-oxoguanine DNA glycosylase
MRALSDPDAFPASDLGLLRGASLNDKRELARRAENWRPWRAYAAMYLWQAMPKMVFSRDERSSTRRTAILNRSAAA